MWWRGFSSTSATCISPKENNLCEINWPLFSLFYTVPFFVKKWMTKTLWIFRLLDVAHSFWKLNRNLPFHDNQLTYDSWEDLLPWSNVSSQEKIRVLENLQCTNKLDSFSLLTNFSVGIWGNIKTNMSFW